MACSLKAGDSFIGHDGYGQPAILFAENVRLVDGEYRVVVTSAKDGLSTSTTLNLAGTETVMLVFLRPGLQAALDAFKQVAAEAGVV